MLTYAIHTHLANPKSLQPSLRTNRSVLNLADRLPQLNMSWLVCTAGSLSRALRAATPKVVTFSSSLYFWLSAGCSNAFGSNCLMYGHSTTSSKHKDLQYGIRAPDEAVTAGLSWLLKRLR